MDVRISKGKNISLKGGAKKVVSDFNKIRDLIRTELSKVFFDLFKKRNMWI